MPKPFLLSPLCACSCDCFGGFDPTRLLFWCVVRAYRMSGTIDDWNRKATGQRLSESGIFRSAIARDWFLWGCYSKSTGCGLGEVSMIECCFVGFSWDALAGTGTFADNDVMGPQFARDSTSMNELLHPVVICEHWGLGYCSVEMTEIRDHKADVVVFGIS